MRPWKIALSFITGVCLFGFFAYAIVLEGLTHAERRTAECEERGYQQAAAELSGESFDIGYEYGYAVAADEAAQIVDEVMESLSDDVDLDWDALPQPESYMAPSRSIW